MAIYHTPYNSHLSLPEWFTQSKLPRRNAKKTNRKLNVIHTVEILVDLTSPPENTIRSTAVLSLMVPKVAPYCLQ